ncbi:hypothetical protein QOT17_007119 [Balamuthia mandrillaris]
MVARRDFFLAVAALAAPLFLYALSRLSGSSLQSLPHVHHQGGGAAALVGPGHGLVRDFHNMLLLPGEFVSNKISFRSCVSHDSETVVADIHGPGCIRLLWMVTGMGNRKARPKACVYTRDALMMVLRVYFDGSTTPSIEAPLGSLFGIHHENEDRWGNLDDGYGADNILFKVSQNGALSLLAPMPFANGCRITLQDENPDMSVKMRMWVQVSYYQYPTVTPTNPMPETLRLRALYRRQDRAHDYRHAYKHNFKRSYHVGHAIGSGYVLGFTMGLSRKDEGDHWFHNGGELIILDHTTNPRVIKGTGGEDFFGTSCQFSKHHNFPDWGFMYGNNSVQFSAYRFFVSDFQIRFRSEFSFEYGANKDVVETVLFWYQDQTEHSPLSEDDVSVEKLPPVWQRLEPVNNSIPPPSLVKKPPTGAVSIWRFTSPFSLEQWIKIRNVSSATLPSQEGLKYELEIEPTFGFVSIGEHFFTYTTNEGYPVNIVVYGQAILESAQNKEVTFVITHDDPFELFLNGQLIHRQLESTFAFQSYSISVSLKQGANTLHCTSSNTENVNTRAWVFGLVVLEDVEQQQRTSMFLAPLGTNTGVFIDGSCR